MSIEKITPLEDQEFTAERMDAETVGDENDMETASAERVVEQDDTVVNDGTTSSRYSKFMDGLTM